MALTPREHQALRPLAPTREVYVQPWRENVERVREALTPRDHHRLCRVNMPTEWSRECNCPHDEVELDHVALDALTTQIEELEWERDEWRKDAKVWQEIAEKREDINLSSIPPVTEALHAMADTMPRPKDRCPECGKPVAEQGERHVHDWELITEEPITKVRSGYVRNWGNDYPVTWQTGVRRRFYCSICRETVEDSETFVHHVRLSA